MEGFKFFKKSIVAVIICLFMIMSQIAVYAASASGGGGSSYSGGGASGGGGSSYIGGGASGGGGGYDEDEYYDDDYDYSGYNFVIGSGSGGGNGDEYDEDELNNYTTVNDYNKSTNTTSQNYVLPNNSVQSNVVKNNINTVNAQDLIGYQVVSNAFINGNPNSSGVMVTNGSNTRFVITKNNGSYASEYLTDWAVLTNTNGSQGWYHFDANGNMTTGFYTDKDGNTYYLQENGTNKGMMAVGLTVINGKELVFSQGADGLPYGALIK